MDLARHGIRVNSVTPTSTDPRPGWEIAAAWGREVPSEVDPVYTQRARQLPLGRMPVPDDYAKAVAFLVSPSAGAITGTDLAVDAGALAKYWAWDAATAQR
jgi:NAD(P)-dependent dehydrogenase (short-subunit alcohol dehydrogenase family)